MGKVLGREKYAVILEGRQKILKEIKAAFRDAIYDYPDWCHTQFAKECGRLGELVKQFIEYNKSSGSAFDDTDEIFEALVEVIFECDDIVVNIVGQEE